jgi:hypothetical protein
MTNSDLYHSSFSAVAYMQLGGVVLPLWTFNAFVAVQWCNLAKMTSLQERSAQEIQFFWKFGTGLFPYLGKI